MTLPSLMRAAFITAPGEPIQVGDLAVPRPGENEVVLRAVALAVNHIDAFIRSGAFPTPLPSPFIIGRDVVGQVAAVGEGVSWPRIGQWVWCNSLGYAGRQGSFSQYVLADTRRIFELPAGIEPVAAVSALHTVATAHLGLRREAGLRPGQTVFIGGAGGGVGSAAVQVARQLGARVIASTSAGDLEWVRGLGADTVLDYQRDDVPARLRDAAPEGVDVYWDNSGHHDFATTLPLLRGGGCAVVAAGLETVSALPVGALYTRDLSVRGFAISNAPVVDLAAAAETVNTQLAAGLVTRIGARLPLEHAAEAHRLLTDSAVSGRIVVVANEEAVTATEPVVQ